MVITQGHIRLTENARTLKKLIPSICDDGAGILEDIQTKIFDLFFTTKPAGTGAGLGLSITHTIIEQYNGTIAVESESGKGTKFTVALPIEK